MLVTENTIFQPSNVRVRITSMRAEDFLCELSPETTIHETKVKALAQFLGAGESVKESLYHRLILVRTGKVLNDEMTVKVEELEENDELILVKRRIQPPPFEVEKRDESRKTPSLEQIREATSGVPNRNHQRPPDEPQNSVDFQAELRKILISLIEASQKILCLDPEAAKIFKQADDIMNENSNEENRVDAPSLRQLVDMGFSEDRARKALKINRMHVTEAMDWLIQNPCDSETDKPRTQPTEEVTTETKTSTDEEEAVVEESGRSAEGSGRSAEGSGRSAEASGRSAEASGRSAEASGRSAEASGRSDDISGGRSHVTKLLDTFRAFRKREFKPNTRALQNLIEMGFTEKEVVNALRVSGNNQDAACDWLLSDSRPIPDNIDQGLDTSGPIYQAIMANPTVQLGLNNPRSLLAFLQMLDNPFSTTQWLSDPETGPMLVQISRIYHAEKNSNKSQSSSIHVAGGGR